MPIKPKTIIIIACIVAVLLALTVFGIWAYRKGKKKVTIKDVPVDDPTGANNANGVSQAEITAIADSLFRDMDGFNVWGHDVTPYERLTALSDTDFVKAYNTFNALHQQDSAQTLKQWIQSETFVFDDVVESIIARMGRLNLI